MTIKCLILSLNPQGVLVMASNMLLYIVLQWKNLVNAQTKCIVCTETDLLVYRMEVTDIMY